MKKNKFWIIIGVLFLVLVVLNYSLVSLERDKLSREELAKKRAINDLEAIRDRAKSGTLANDETRKAIELGVQKITSRLTEIDAYLSDYQKDFLYVKGDKEWKHSMETNIQYRDWYKNKRDELILKLQQSGFLFEKEGEGEITPNDMVHIKEKMGFKTWGSETPPEKDLLEAHQQLALISVIVNAMESVFKDSQNVFPIFEKVIFDSWPISGTGIGVLVSKVTFKIDCPYAYINKVINALEKAKIQLKVEDMEVTKKVNTKDYIEFPNVKVTLKLSFQIIKEKKVGQ